MRSQRKQVWAVPEALPTWTIDYEVWQGGQPYRMGTMRIPAETEQTARQAVVMVLREVMPNLFPDAEIRMIGSLIREAQ